MPALAPYERNVVTLNENRNHLACLKAGQTAVVQQLSAEGPMSRRLQDLGLIAGTRVECLGKSPLGDPCAYLIRGAVIALRASDAASVLLERVTEEPSPLPKKSFLRRAENALAE